MEPGFSFFYILKRIPSISLRNLFLLIWERIHVKRTLKKNGTGNLHNFNKLFSQLSVSPWQPLSVETDSLCAYISFKIKFYWFSLGSQTRHLGRSRGSFISHSDFSWKCSLPSMILILESHGEGWWSSQKKRTKGVIPLPPSFCSK